MKQTKEIISSVRSEIAKLHIGGMLTYPIERKATIKNYASDLGMLQKKRFVTRSDRAERTISITRVQ